MLFNYLEKKILIDPNIQVFFFMKNNKKYLRFTSFTKETYFVFIPNYINFKIKESSFILKSNLLNKKYFELYFNYLNAFLKKINKTYRKKLFLKGLGFKMYLSACNQILELKVGFSHLLQLSDTSKKLKLNINKNCITIEGYNLSSVGNFAAKLKKCKMPDIYKGKGFLYKNERFVLKEIKKK